MNKNNDQPDDYIPYNEIEVCSNTIIGGGNLVVIGNVVPIYVGVGYIPKVWLKSVDDIKSKRFIEVVEASISKHPAIKINSYESDITIKINNIVILKTNGNTKNKLIISQLDMRPLGINIHGDESGLMAGGMAISKSTFNGIGSLVALG